MQNSVTRNVLSEEIILVQSKGMQHWLNLQLAESRGISMNLDFCLPIQFFWRQIRAILGSEIASEQSVYSKDVLTWRIYALLATDDVMNNPLCAVVTQYWYGENEELENEKISSRHEDKRFQLACQLGDLFEQYLLFRPDWIIAWDNGVVEEHPDKKWQAYLWQQLVAQDPNHPVVLLRLAIDSLKKNKSVLPERISLFGINTLPPLWLEFLSELGNYTQIHFFHLNPCVEYWGDVKTERAIAQEQFNRWVEMPDLEVGLSAIDCADSNVDSDAWLEEYASNNPLLANLGTQGKDFLFLLQEHTSVEIPVFESPEELSDTEKKSTVLHKVQADILTLHDKRSEPINQIDDSIVIASAHSALREIQALHDWLLHQFNDDKTLTPKDIVVMCPNVEKYAPYVEAVFAHGWYDWSERIPPLPCSIADRTLKDSEPLVQAFIQLLELPDSRFQVSQVLDYVRLPSLQDKFAFSEEDLVLLERWINHAAIHWGIDDKHKDRILSTETSNEKFSWQQGLNRLMLGFAQGDQETLYQSQLLLPDVEGDEAILLGRFFELLDALQFYARELLIARTPNDWRHFLYQAKATLFSTLVTDNSAHQMIDQAIDDLGEYTAHAQFDETISLPVIHEFLLAHFNQPEPGRQFMSGQVTFCSMVPMRSVPFRVIAVLGLNDGEFPRQRQPMGFDLIAAEPPRKGDRSLRGDDRYLFLEALISCREKLYLSYQGHDIKTNNVREPSLVLQELMDYLEKGYGWKLTSENEPQIHRIPLQAFSQANYHHKTHEGTFNSFNPHWLALNRVGAQRNNLVLSDRASVDSLDDSIITLNAEQLVRFFDNPSRQFAQTKLGLYLEDGQDFVAEDSEPFSTNHLDRYLLQEKIVQALLSPEIDEMALDDLMEGVKLSGKLPDTPNIESELQDWKQQAVDFSQQIKNVTSTNAVSKTAVQISIEGILLEAELPVLNDDDGSLLYWRLATPKGKDDIRLWVHHLIAQVIADKTLGAKSVTRPITRGIFRGKKDDAAQTIQFNPVESAEDKLATLIQCWKAGMESPLLLNASLGQQACSKDPLSTAQFEALWCDDFQSKGLGSDPYVNWFWSGSEKADGLPQWQGKWQEQVETIYSPLYEHRVEISS